MMAGLGGGLDGKGGRASLLPFTGDCRDDVYPYLRMDGKEVYRFAVQQLPRTIERLCAAAGVSPEEVNLVIPHQANRRIIEAAAFRAGIPLERFYVNLERYANTSAASIPIALDEALRAGKLRRGDLVIMAGFGAGLTWGGILMRWTAVPAWKREGENHV
jgi:3-oxoacyl-[acyl-carrier-protein] synthase-3